MRGLPPMEVAFQSCVRGDVTPHVTSRVVASIHAQKYRTGNTYRVLWRQDGRQRSLTFENLPAAERFKTLLEDHGPDEALHILERPAITPPGQAASMPRDYSERSSPTTSSQSPPITSPRRPHTSRCLRMSGTRPSTVQRRFATAPRIMSDGAPRLRHSVVEQRTRLAAATRGWIDRLMTSSNSSLTSSGPQT
jgi:hypothetical protein